LKPLDPPSDSGPVPYSKRPVSNNGKNREGLYYPEQEKLIFDTTQKHLVMAIYKEEK
jgi:hypothetical protein